MLGRLLFERHDIGEVKNGLARERALHEFEPKRKGGARASFFLSERDLFVVKANPDSGSKLRREADEPRVRVVLRRAGLSGSGVVMPKRRAMSTTELMVSFSASLTAGTLREPARARRRVIVPSNLSS